MLWRSISPARLDELTNNEVWADEDTPIWASNDNRFVVCFYSEAWWSCTRCESGPNGLGWEVIYESTGGDGSAPEAMRAATQWVKENVSHEEPV